MNIPARLLLLTTALFASTAQATVFFIDDFEITRGGQTLFLDSFGDDIAPSTGYIPPDIANQDSYNTRPDPMPGPEANGKLALDPADGEARNSNVTGIPILIQRARVRTPKDASGLANSVDFSVTGVFDLIEPTLPGREFYGVRLTDFDSNNNNPNDNAQLRVHVDPNGDWRVWFVEADFDNGVFVELGAVVLDDQLLIDNSIPGSLSDYDQIALTLTHTVPTGAVSNSVTASFSLFDVDTFGPTGSINVGGTATLFTGEIWTRASFLTAQRVPLPPTLVLLGLGIAGLVWRRRWNGR